jgi:hypothetical protein
MSYSLEEENKALLKTYAYQVSKFREFCILHGTAAAFDDADFSDLSLGFFIALGVTGDSGTNEPFYDAFVLSTVCRYTLQYWEGEQLENGATP